MNMIATDGLQSQRLLRCGVSADTADMIETRLGNLLNRTQDFPVDETKETLVWSLSALLSNILPCDISDNEIDYSLFLQRRRSADNTPMWELSYYNLEYDATLLFVEVADPIESAVQMVERLTANGYKLNGINEKGQ
jgi:hypothetical protein